MDSEYQPKLLVVVAALLAIPLWSISWGRRKLSRSASAPPTIPSNPLLLGLDHCLALYRDLPGFVEEARKRYGPVFSFTIMGQKFAFITHPASVIHIDRSDVTDPFLTIDRALRAMAGLFTVEPIRSSVATYAIPLITRHLSSAKIMQPQSKERFARILSEELDNFVRPGNPTSLALDRFISEVMHHTASQYLFGSRFPRSQTYQDFRIVHDNITPLSYPLASWIPFYQPNRARQRLMGHLMEYVSPCWEPGVDIALVLPDADQLIVDMLTALREDGLSVQQTAGVLAVFLLGLHPNTWFHTYHMLGQLLLNPIWRSRAEEEARTAANLSHMPFLESSMNEALRRPYRILQIRDTVKDAVIELGGSRYFLEKGTLLFTKSINHEDSIYNEPFVFKADRFLRTKVPKARGFGEGHRWCKGKELAKLEMMSFVATCLQRYDMKLLNREGKSAEQKSSKDFPLDSSLFTTPCVPESEDYLIELSVRQ